MMMREIDESPARIITQEIIDALPMPVRPMAPFCWFGGKGRTAKWLLKFLPAYERVTTYVEPFAGAASLLWHLPKPYPVEVLNDLDERIVTLFRVLQDREKFDELAHRIVWTPYARAEFARALAILRSWEQHDDITRAWAFFTAQNGGISGRAESEGNWGRVLTNSTRGSASTASAHRARMKLLGWWHDRLTRVQIDRTDGIEAIRYWDTPETFFYIDPPYVWSARKSGAYKCEVDDEYHQQLTAALLEVRGMVMLSGYANDIYAQLEHMGWRRYELRTTCSAAARTRVSGILGHGSAKSRVPRTECIWINYEPPATAARTVKS
jgi:DNA adenine methylase